MAHKKGVGSTKNGRDSESKRLGVKIFGGQSARAGNIIIRQRGTRYHPGEGVGLGKDHTIYATTDGTVLFRRKRNNRTFVSVLPAGEVVEARAAAKPKAAPKAEPVVEEVVAAAPVEEAVVEAPVAEEVIAEAPAVEEVAAEAPAAEAPVEEKKPKAKAKKAAKGDDLKKIEGIGPKIAEILTNAGMGTFKAVSEATPDQIREILLEAGKRYASHNPETWPKQAAFAAEGKWDELKAWQDELDGGRA